MFVKMSLCNVRTANVNVVVYIFGIHSKMASMSLELALAVLGEVECLVCLAVSGVQIPAWSKEAAVSTALI